MPEERTTPTRLGMDELSFFTQMVKSLLNQVDVQAEARFWATIYKHCPNLTQAIRASFTGEYAHLTFTRSIHSSAFMVDDTDDPEPQERESTPE
jgi:hypothetical protein